MRDASAFADLLEAIGAMHAEANATLASHSVRFDSMENRQNALHEAMNKVEHQSR